VKHLPGTGPHKPLLLLVNFDWALEPARPTSPSIKFLGALMPREPHPLPNDIQSWLDASSDKPGAHQLASLQHQLRHSAVWWFAPGLLVLLLSLVAASACCCLTLVLLLLLPAVAYLSFGASFTAPEAAVPAVVSATAAALSHMRFILSMKQPEQQLLKVGWVWLSLRQLLIDPTAVPT
jgi:hypothetical protein